MTMTTCDRCECEIDSSELDSYSLCPDCAEEFEDCGNCGRRTHTDDLDEHGECPRCVSTREEEESYDEEEENSDGLLDYSARVPSYIDRVGEDSGASPRFIFRNPKTLYMGVELEVEVDLSETSRYRAVENTRDILSEFAILKEDGSLNHGYEITSIPATLEYHRKHAPWAELFADAAFRDGHKATPSTTGVHIHVSRSALSPLQIGKAMVFLNDPRNLRFTEDIAGRSASSYQKRAPKKLTVEREGRWTHCLTLYRPMVLDLIHLAQDAHPLDKVRRPLYREEYLAAYLELEYDEGIEAFTPESVARVLMRESWGKEEGVFLRVIRAEVDEISYEQWTPGPTINRDRYEATNLTQETLEIRIFQGTTRSQADFMRYLEFTHALMIYCAPANSSARALNFEHFTQWVDKPTQRRTYPVLLKWLSAHGYILPKLTKVS